MQLVNIDAVLSVAPEQCLLLLRGNLEVVDILWAYEEAFASVFCSAIVNIGAERSSDTYFKPARGLLDAVYARLVSKPSDVTYLCASLKSDDLAECFLEDYVRSPLAKTQVVYGLARQPMLFAALPKAGGWQEVVVHGYGAHLMNAYPQRRFTLEELIPLGIDIDRPAARSLLGSALEAKQLTPESKMRLLSLFSDDPTLKWLAEKDRE